MRVCVGEYDTIKSTSIKSSLVTVQCTQLTVWKLCCAFFSSRLFCSQGSLLANLTFFLSEHYILIHTLHFPLLFVLILFKLSCRRKWERAVGKQSEEEEGREW